MIKKLSLAALVAMGGMSFASATPLTEAIKNVDLNGMLRIRFYNEQPDGSHDYRRWRTNGIFIFKVPASENINFVMRNSVQTNVYTHDDNLVTTPNDINSTNIDDNIVNNLLFMQYTNGPLNAIVGKIPVATPVTSADPATPGHGAGAIASYKVNDNLTGAGFFVDALVNPSDNSNLGKKIAHNIAGAAAIFNVNNIKGQVWYFNINSVADSIITASANIDLFKLANIQNDYNVQFHVDYAFSKLHHSFAKANKLSTDPKNYFNIAATASADKTQVELGYAYSDKHKGAVELSYDAPIGAVIPVEQYYNIANLVETSSIYGKVGYNVDSQTNVFVEGQYQDAGIKSGNKNNDLVEYAVGANYQMTKKLSFRAYYDIADWDSKADYKDNNEFEFQAKYTF